MLNVIKCAERFGCGEEQDWRQTKLSFGSQPYPFLAVAAECSYPPISAIPLSSHGRRMWLPSVNHFLHLHNRDNSYLMDSVWKLNKASRKEPGTP